MGMIDWQKSVQEAAHKAGQMARRALTREYSARGLALLFLIALGGGMVTKSLLNDSLTIGFDDYTLTKTGNVVDLNILQKELIRNGGSLATTEQTVPRGDSCSEKEN